MFDNNDKGSKRKTCTRSPASPIVDSVVGSLFVGAGGVGLANAQNVSVGVAGSDASLPTKTPIQVMSIAAVTVGTIFYGSAAYGYYTSAKCGEFYRAKMKEGK